MESLDKIAEALAKAQGEFNPITRNRSVEVTTKNNGRYTFRYADLPTIIAETKDILAKYELCVVHKTTVTDNGNMVLTSWLLHSSGQYLESQFALRISEEDRLNPQKMGSLISYAKRYSVSSLLNLATEEDDDGNAAAGNSAKDIPKKKDKPEPPKSFYVYDTAHSAIAFDDLEKAARGLAAMLKKETNEIVRADLLKDNNALMTLLTKEEKFATIDVINRLAKEGAGDKATG